MIRRILYRDPFDDQSGDVVGLSFRPGMVAMDAMPPDLVSAHMVFVVNGEEAQSDQALAEGDLVCASVVPEWAEVTLGSILINALVSVAVSFVFSMLFGAPKQPENQNDEESPSYGWTGSRQTRRPGAPIAESAGRFRLGGTVIGEYIIAQATPARSVLFQLVCLGEGPFQDIAGVTADTIDGQAIEARDNEEIGRLIHIGGDQANNLRGVSAHFRMGSNEQAVVEWFRDVRKENPIGHTLPAVEIEAADNSGLYFDPAHWFTTGNEDLWREYAIAFTMTDEADSATARIRCARGLYRTNTTTGEIQSAHIGLQIRYRELDAIGSQIRSGGANGDGWVYLPPILPFGVERRDAFEFQADIPFFDKDTYAPPGIGSCFDTDAQAAALATFPKTPGEIPDGTTVDAFGASAWINVPSLGTGGTQYHHLFGDFNNGTKRGWAVGINVVTDTLTLGTFWSLAVETGDGSSRTLHRITIPNIFFDTLPLGAWAHVAVSYEAGGYLRAWINGHMVVNDSVGLPSVVWSDSLHFGSNPNGVVTGSVDVQIDDFLMWDAALSTDQIAEQIALGSGRFGTGYISTLRCWIPWVPPSGITQRATSPWYTDGALSGGAVLVVGGGVVQEDPEVNATYKRGRYHIEVVRTNYDSTAPETSDLAELASIQTILSEEHAYGGHPLMALRVEANDQLSGSMGETSAVCRTRKWPIWDGVSTSNPSVSMLYTANPAWICYGILTARGGLGRFYSLTDVDLIELKAWADYCDEILLDGSYPLDFSATDATSDIRFLALEEDPVTTVVRGAFEVILPKAEHAELPTSWQPDSWVLLEGLPGTPTISMDVNGGYKIYKIDDNGAAWSVWLWWDRLNEGTPWPSGDLLGATVLGVILGAAHPDSLIRGGIPRFEFHGTFERHGSAWEAMVAVAAVARAAPIPSGNKVRFRYSAPRQPSAVIGRGGIMDGSFKMAFGGQSDQTNAYDFTFQDRTKSYERTADTLFSDSVTDTGDASLVIRKTTTLFGVTHLQQAIRQLTYDLRARERLKRRASLDAPIASVSVTPGDVVMIDTDLLLRGVSGLLMDGNTLTTLYLDQAATFEVGESYEVYLQRLGEGFAVGAVDVAAMGGPGTYPYGTLVPVTGLTELPTRGMAYILAKVGDVLIMEVGSSKLQQDMTRTMELVEYDETIFEDL